jgi:hypothetical protein
MRKEIVTISLLLFAAIALGFLSVAVRGVYADPSNPVDASAQTDVGSPEPVGMPVLADETIPNDALSVPQGVPVLDLDAEQSIEEMPQGVPVLDLNAEQFTEETPKGVPVLDLDAEQSIEEMPQGAPVLDLDAEQSIGMP